MPTNQSEHRAIRAHPRLHLTLIAMDCDGYRINGGIGFCIDEPSVLVSMKTSGEFRLFDDRCDPLEVAEINRLSEVAKYRINEPVEITISGQMPSHFGFGSATAIRLAVLEIAALLKNADVVEDKLVRQSGRGATSGIGVTTYFSGGLVFDIGSAIIDNGLMPSSAIEGTRPAPLVIAGVEMPDWPVGLCIPSGIPPQSAEQERAFFKRACPIPKADVQETLYHVVYGLLAGAKERNFGTFSMAIRNIQQCTWKRLERGLYGDSLQLIESEIYRDGAAAVGMTSLGPGLYFLADDVADVVRRLKIRLPQHHWLATTCRNAGRDISQK